MFSKPPKNKLVSDEELMIRMVNHSDHEALAELYTRYSKRLLHFLIKLLNGDQERAQDFLQDIFIVVFEKKHLFNPDKKFYSWLFTIANNKCLNWFRDNKMVDIGSAFDKIEQQTNPSLSLENKELKKELRLAIHALAYPQKVVFILRHIEQFSLAEIATITDTSIGTVKSRLYYATQNMAVKMKVHYLENEVK